MSRMESSSPIISGRASTMLWKVRHWPTRQKVSSPVLTSDPLLKPSNGCRMLRCASRNCLP